jgi:hypothetical protein
MGRLSLIADDNDHNVPSTSKIGEPLREQTSVAHARATPDLVWSADCFHDMRAMSWKQIGMVPVDVSFALLGQLDWYSQIWAWQ